MALDAPLAALERHCGLARGHGRFFLNAGAFIGLMVVSNALEEELYTNLPGFDYFKAVACLELATFASAALYAERRSGLKTPRKAPLAFYAVLGASMALSQTLGKLANKYVNFTVSTIFKCSKALIRVETNQAVMGIVNCPWRDAFLGRVMLSRSECGGFIVRRSTKTTVPRSMISARP